MCTSIVVNRKKTLVGWNLDLLDMEHRVRLAPEGVYIEIHDAAEGWMPLFGANARGDFVGMPTCWPFDARSDPKDGGENVIRLDRPAAAEEDLCGGAPRRGDEAGVQRPRRDLHVGAVGRARKRAAYHTGAGRFVL